MANVILNPQLQNLGAGDDLALALKEFAGLVLTAYPTKTVALEHCMQKTITEGSSHQFPAIWKMTAEEHTKGTELVGNNEPISEERTVNVDTKQLVAHAYIDTVDEFIAHFDTRQERAVQAARAIARTVDSRLIRCAILGARQSARGPASEFPAGNTLDSPRSGPLATAYPPSLTGSKRLQADFAEIAQKMDEKDVPEDNRVALITPYLSKVFAQDDTLESVDYQSPNNKFTRKLLMVEGFLCKKTNQMPSTNVTTGQTAYQGDFTKTVCAFMADNTAVGQVKFGGIIPEGPTWVVTRLAWLLLARHLQGAKWIRPEACGEIALA